jgi:hypothetical protein
LRLTLTYAAATKDERNAADACRQAGAFFNRLIKMLKEEDNESSVQ